MIPLLHDATATAGAADAGTAADFRVLEIVLHAEIAQLEYEYVGGRTVLGYEYNRGLEVKVEAVL